uniref:Uncharacterized protein n=1 Tax=Anguilla anguilla TaxID=7936 RepID=A0A0E9XVC7_ANGAN
MQVDLYFLCDWFNCVCVSVCLCICLLVYCWLGVVGVGDNQKK